MKGEGGGGGAWVPGAPNGRVPGGGGGGGGGGGELVYHEHQMCESLGSVWWQASMRRGGGSFKSVGCVHLPPTPQKSGRERCEDRCTKATGSATELWIKKYMLSKDLQGTSD